MGVGNELKKVRKEKELSLKEIEQETKIRKKYLRDLEEEDYDKIPGDAYVKAFIKNYSECLGLDSSEMLNVYKKQQVETITREQPDTEKQQTVQNQSTRFQEIFFVLKKVLPIIFIIVLIIIFLLFVRKSFIDSGINSFSIFYLTENIQIERAPITGALLVSYLNGGGERI